VRGRARGNRDGEGEEGVGGGRGGIRRLRNSLANFSPDALNLSI
jgi:hypothetical protein